MKALTRIVFVDDNKEKFFGEGPYRLLLGIEELHSVRAAADSMNMAYTKAIKLIKNAEKALGFPLTVRLSGGAKGGGSTLTPKGKEWLSKYAEYTLACRKANQKLYEQFFN